MQTADQELLKTWKVHPNEMALLRSKNARWRLGLALQWKFFEQEHRFPEDRSEIPATAVEYVAGQLGSHPRHFADYILDSGFGIATSRRRRPAAWIAFAGVR